MKQPVQVAHFLVYLEKELGRSPKTIENYRRYLMAYFSFTHINNPQKITLQSIDAFRQYLATSPGSVVGGIKQPLKPKTQDYYLIAMRSFLAYLALKGIPSLVPARIVLHNPGASPVVSVTLAEITRLQKIVYRDTPIDFRDRAIIELLLHTGMTIQEVCALNLDEVSFKKSKCLVSRSRGQVRTLSLSHELVAALKNYLRVRRDTDTALFVQFGKNARNATTLRVSPRSVQRMLRQRSIAAGITTPVTPKTLRQYVAANLLRTGESLADIQTRLGHLHEASTTGLLKRAVLVPEATPAPRRPKQK